MQAYRSIREIKKPTTDPYASIRAALFKKYAPTDSKNRVRSVRPEQLVDRTTALSLGIQENDLWIAAIAIEYHMILVTEDKMARIQEVAPPPLLTVVKWKRSLPAQPPPLVK
jgi:tRNA(fMet)-specific endonuclease VapC